MSRQSRNNPVKAVRGCDDSPTVEGVTLMYWRAPDPVITPYQKALMDEALRFARGRPLLPIWMLVEEAAKIVAQNSVSPLSPTVGE